MNRDLIEKIVHGVKKEIGERADVQFKEIKKNNGVICRAIVFSEPEKSVIPVIYIDDMLKRYESGGVAIHNIVQNITLIYSAGVTEKITYFSAGITKEYILENVVYHLVGTARNRQMLADIPHIDFLDLSAIYSVDFSLQGSDICSIKVTRELCSNYCIEMDELDKAAKSNTEKRGFSVRAMSSVISELTGYPEEACDDGNYMYVLTNDKAYYGAAVMLYESYFKELAGQIESDLYVLPSSIHEVITVPKSNIEMHGLKDMVECVNANEVDEVDVLSGNVYLYSRNEGRLMIAQDV